MAVTGLTLVADALKLEYLDSFRYQFDQKADPLLAQLEGDPTMIQAGEVVMALRYGRSGGIGALATDISTLPDTNSRKTKQVKFGTKNLTARIMISDKTIEVSKSNIGAFANLLKQELEDAQADAKDDLSRQVYGDGTGVLATCGEATSKTVIPVDDTKYFAHGMFVDILQSDGTPVAQKREVTAVDDSGLTITISGAAINTAATDIVVRAGNYGNEILGLDAVFTDDNTIYGLDRSANKWFNATHITHNGEIRDTVIMKGIQAAGRKGCNVNYISTTDGVVNAYYDSLQTFKRNPNYLELKGGWRALAFVSPQGEIAMMGAKYAPTGKIRLLDLSRWHMAQLADWDYMDRDGNMLSRVSNLLAYEATLRKYCELACDHASGQVEITGVVEH